MGNAWDPADALLTWTLSHAADDRTSSTTFQNPSFLRSGDTPPEQAGARHADAEVNGAASPRAAAVATASRPYGSPGYIVLRDGGPGVRLTVESQTPGLRWAVLRLR